MGLRDRAYASLKQNWLATWWSSRYNLPWRTSPLFAAYTQDQLILEYMEWFVQEYPERAMMLSEGEKVKFHTGDAVIDRLESRLVDQNERITEDEILNAFLEPESAKDARQWLESLNTKRQLQGDQLSRDIIAKYQTSSQDQYHDQAHQLQSGPQMRHDTPYDPRLNAPDNDMRHQLQKEYTSLFGGFGDRRNE